MNSQISKKQRDTIDGAIVGGVRGRRAKKAKDQQQQQANNAAADAASKEAANDYNKAFSACMEGKGYTVK